MNKRSVILQVEDREEDVFLFRYACKRAGIDNPIYVAEDGRDAIEYLKGSGKYADRSKFPLPDIVLLDLQMPHVQGLQVLEWIRQQPAFKTLIVVILSSSMHEGDVRRAYELGANAFLVKPSSTETMADLCVAFKHFWLTHNMSPREIIA